ncbi:phospholipase D-like domain-containing protein [Fibrella forsythiae]|uniref:PLD phosphodiesterase domain-containing protein n=1 Tax=Fibrella forsythiae TaxID=2817061 RepID=A0ABS3JCH5_9BACT|nr:phospholipase D-like domain-containing protein [Fibrella forsythiae]MBO0947131.1 hypothetical protein [Fibrella forsythiae]
MATYVCTRCRREFTLQRTSSSTAKCHTCGQMCTQKAVAKAPVQVVGRPQPHVVTTPPSVVNNTALVVKPMAPKPLPPDPFQLVPGNVLNLILQYCDERTLGMFGMVCKRFKPFAYSVLTRLVPHMAAYGSTTHNLKEVVKHYITTRNDVQHSLRLAVDKFPYPHGKSYSDSILDYILKNRIPIDLILGTRDQHTINAFKKAKQRSEAFLPSGEIQKMHNKVWTIDAEGIIIGSPNISYSGLEDINFESCIYIKSLRLGHLIGQYMDLLKQPNPSASPLWKEIGQKLIDYNSEDHHLQVALAPIIDIQDFVITHLQDASKIIIRQFLVSPSNEQKGLKSIVDFLCTLSWKHRVDIELFIDESAYYSEATGYFVKKAVRQLIYNKVKVYLQKPVTVVTAHEALQHDKLILAELRSGKQITLLGSAGFTSAVIANNNAESFIYTDVASVYNSMMKHHNSTLKKEKGVTLTFD